MKDTTEIQKKILQAMCNEQVRDGRWDDEDEHSYYVNDDETPLFTYKHLEKLLEVPKARLRPEMLELRNEQMVELMGAVDYEYYAPCGSGWCITKKGLAHALLIGITPEV